MQGRISIIRWRRSGEENRAAILPIVSTTSVYCRNEATIYAVSDELFKCANSAEHHSRAAGHCLQRRQGDGFISRGHRVYTTAAKKITHLGTTDKPVKPYAR
jgi:hypothetical protein